MIRIFTKSTENLSPIPTERNIKQTLHMLRFPKSHVIRPQPTAPGLWKTIADALLWLKWPTADGNQHWPENQKTPYGLFTSYPAGSVLLYPVWTPPNVVWPELELCLLHPVVEWVMQYMFIFWEATFRYAPLGRKVGKESKWNMVCCFAVWCLVNGFQINPFYFFV